MPVHRNIAIPLAVLSSAFYTPHKDGEGSLRPSGKSLTGSDLQIWYLILDAAEHAVDYIVDIPQVSITKLLDRENPTRIRAGLDRLRGTNMVLSNGTIMPTVIAFDHVGVGTEPRVWRIQIDRRAYELVQASIRMGKRGNIRTDELKEMSSRYSFGLYSRWVGCLHGEFPSDRAIGMGKRPSKQAFQLDIPLDKIGAIFAIGDRLRPSEVERLLVTKSPKSPLKREMGRAGIDVDSHLTLSDATDLPASLRILISSKSLKQLSFFNALERHKENDFRVRRERYRQHSTN
ncbi:hypothetical protein [Pelagibacterium sediminicola]|uniref:hypothetical protein n=1 Tax=Pelagibacterium sediminicola TaxID=2248761 RepID=UPI000E30E760|nr:hypothetical protein [Pelagibacterium sediminicola]